MNRHEEFAKANNVTMRVKHIRFGKYLKTDEVPRHIHRITIERGDKEYGFMYPVGTTEGYPPDITMEMALKHLSKTDPGDYKEFLKTWKHKDTEETSKKYMALASEWLAMKDMFADVLEDFTNL